MPQIGESGDYGFYLKNLGYYWAPNQYMDYRVLLNFYDRDGGTINTLLRYKKIYKYSGNISTSLTQNLRSSSDIFDILNSYSRLWSLNWLHTQDDNRFGELKINYNYVSSSSYYQDSNISIDQFAANALMYQKSPARFVDMVRDSIPDAIEILQTNPGFSYEPEAVILYLQKVLQLLI